MPPGTENRVGRQAEVLEQEGRGPTEQVGVGEAFRTMVEQAPVGVLVTRVLEDGRRVIVQANEALARMLGEPVESLLGGNLDRFFAAEDVPGVIATLRAVAAGEAQPRSQLLRLRRADGASVWSQAQSAMIELPC